MDGTVDINNPNFSKRVKDKLKVIEEDEGRYPYIAPHETPCVECGSKNTEYTQSMEFYSLHCQECDYYYESHADGGLIRFENFSEKLEELSDEEK